MSHSLWHTICPSLGTQKMTELIIKPIYCEMAGCPKVAKVYLQKKKIFKFEEIEIK